MGKYLIAGIAIILIAAGAYYFFFKAAPTPVVEEPIVQEPTTLTYTSNTLGFSLTYPRDFGLDELHQYPFAEGKTIGGVKFTIPATMATGTNLAMDSYVSIEQLPRANACTGDIYLIANVRAEDMTEGSVTYSHATSSGAAAGNLYEEHVYAFKNSKPCTAVRYFIHSTIIANYEPGTVREFDRNAVLMAFDAIRRSITLGTTTVATSTGFTP